MAPGAGAPLRRNVFAGHKDYLGPISATPLKNVEELLGMARVGATDVVFDLGCNDGRIPIVAAKKFGARGVGIEIDAGAVRKAKRMVGMRNAAPVVRLADVGGYVDDLETR